MSVIEIPLLNSENFYKVDAITPPQYQTKQFLTDWWQSSLYYWERYNRFYDINKPEFFVKKELDDIVTIQFSLPISFISDVTLEMLSCDGELTWVSDVEYRTSVDIVGNFYDGDGALFTPIPLRTYQYKFKISDIIGSVEGYYYFVISYIEAGYELPIQFISEPTDIREVHEDTILIEYTNGVNDYDVAFQLDPAFNIRVDATLKYLPTPQLDRTVFRNQSTNLRQLYSRNWRNYQITFGASEGIVDIFIDKISNIFKCDVLLIDGKRMILAEGAEFEANPFSERYPLYTLKITLEEYYNNNSVAVVSRSVILVMEVGTYPYVVDVLIMLDSSIIRGDIYVGFLPATEMVEIIDATAESDFIDALNAQAVAFGRTGEFVVDGTNLVYVCGATDPYIGRRLSRLTTCLQVWFDSSPSAESIEINLNQNLSLGKTVVSVWRNSSGTASTENMIAADYVPRLGSAFGDIYQPSNAPDYDSWMAYIYCNDLYTSLNILTLSDNILRLEGDVSPLLETHICVGGDLATLHTTYLRNAKQVIKTINYNGMGITDFSGTAFDRITALDWKYLTNLFLNNNKLDATNQDVFYNELWTNIGSFWLGAYGTGTISTLTQSPTSAPTSASLTARNNLTALGYLIAF